MSDSLDVPAVLGRMKELAWAKTDAELARELGVRRGAISDWRHRGSIPLDRIVGFAATRPVSLDWLLKGEGEVIDYDRGKRRALDARRLALALVEAEQEYRGNRRGEYVRASQLADKASVIYERHRRLFEELSTKGKLTRENFEAGLMKSLGLPDDWDPTRPW
jgi:hypothetical protein